MAYLCLHDKDVLASASAFLKGYSREVSGTELKVQDVELQCLRTLVMGRLATSITLGALSAHHDSKNAYLSFHSKPAAKALKIWAAQSAKDVLERFRIGQ